MPIISIGEKRCNNLRCLRHSSIDCLILSLFSHNENIVFYSLQIGVTSAMNRTQFKKITRKTIMFFLGCFLALLFIVGGIYLVAFLLGPPDLSNEQNTVYYSSSGELFGEEEGSESRYWVDLEAISPHLINATLMIEDQRFYKHKGLDFKRIVGAAIKDLKNRSLKEGASTLTQQYARNLFLSHEKTWTRKLKEAFYAIRIELFYSKKEILEGYLNTIYYGHGAYGIEAASKYYFNKSADNLTLAEAAMLAGIPKGPSVYSPIGHLENATARQQQILKVMLDKEVINNNQYETAMAEELIFEQTSENSKHNIAPYFQDTVLREAAHLLDLDSELVRSGGFKIYTTLDIAMQEELEKNILNQLPESSELEVGAVAMRPEDGAIQALVGGRHYEKSPFNRVTQAKRLAGSTFKPFLYYAALEHGFTPSTKMESKPTAFQLTNGETYQPGNFNGYYADGPITLAQAIALSDNIYAVKTHLYLGTDTLVNTAEDFGIQDDLPAVASLALGTAAVSVEDMVKGYGMIANGGKEINSYSIEKITDRNGKEIYSRETTESEEKLNPQSTFILTQLLTGMFDEELNDYTSVTGAPITDQLTHTFAGKSGTTDADSWMIGFSPSTVTGVWVGYDDNRSMENVMEAASAKEIWADFMEEVHEERPLETFEVPSDVVGVAVDPETGARATPYCPTSKVMYYKNGDEPEQNCTLHFDSNEEDKEIKEDNETEEKGFFEKWLDIFR